MTAAGGSGAGAAGRIRRRLLLILLHAALVQVLTFAVRPNLSYAVLDNGGSPVLLGLIAAAFAVPALIMALPAGHTVDRIGERPALLIGAVTLIIGALLAALAGSSFLVLVLATVLLGCGHLMSVVGDQAMISQLGGTRSLDSKFGLYAFAAAAGQTIGPLLLTLPGGTASIPPVQLIFFACAGLSAVMLVVSVFMRSSRRSGLREQAGMTGKALGLLGTRGLPRALVASSLVLASVDLFVAYLPALGHERQLSAELISFVLMARSLLSMVSRLFLGRMVRLVGRRSLLVWTVGTSAAAVAAVALPLPGVWLVVISAIYGFAIGTCQPITMSWVAELAPPGSQGLAMSLRVASNRVGQTLLPLVLGTFASATGAAGVLVATGVALVAAAWSGAAVGARRPDSTVP